jgi:hypothetical protein
LKYAGWPIEEVARHESIILQIASVREMKRGGMSICQSVETSYLFASLVDEDRLIESRYPAAHSGIQLIALAHDYVSEGEHISLEEIFWHEYFHMNWSLELEPFNPDKHEYSTHGVLDIKDEQHADLFAASVLIDRVEPWENTNAISRSYNVSLKLASIALQAEQRKRLFSREWTPMYT